MRLLLAIILLAATTTACFFRASSHSSIMAAASAPEFAQVAFVEKNYDKAFSMIHPEVQEYAGKEKFAQGLAAMNTPSSPASIIATEYEPIPGQEGMNIYFKGESDRETFYYRIAMKGSQQKGYKPVGVWRNKGPFPKSPMIKPL